MRMDKLTSLFQSALNEAQSLAIGRDNSFIEPVHVMKAMVEQSSGTVYPLLTKANVNINSLQDKLNEALDRLPKVSGGTPGEIHISNDLNRLLNLTDKIAQQRKDQYIPSELFVLAALEDKGSLLNTMLVQAGAS